MMTTMEMKDNMAINAVRTFVIERLGGNVDGIIDYDLGRLRSDKQYGCPGRMFDPDDTNLMRAIYCIVFGDVWSNLSWGKLWQREIAWRHPQLQRHFLLLSMEGRVYQKMGPSGGTD